MTAIAIWAISIGQISYVTTSGVSMNPVYHRGDLVLLVKRDSYEVGQIAAYHDPALNLDVLHRIIGGDGVNGFVFKGDNNQSTDAQTPTADRLLGRAFLHVPQGGVWLKPLLSPTGLGMMGFLIIGGGAALPSNRREIPRGRRKKKVKAMARAGNSAATLRAVANTLARLPGHLRIALAAVWVLLLMAVTLGVLGWLKPAVQTATATGTGQSITFSYVAQAPKSAAYDSTTVTSPDPIFRRIVKRIDLRMHYAGPPGAMDISAKLSNGVGWNSTMQLEPSKKFTSRTYDADVNLDLDALDERAKKAADAIGISHIPVTVVVTARVVSAGVPTFTAPLTLNLTPLHLSLAEGEGALTVKDPSARNRTIVTARTIDVFGQPVMTASAARRWSMFLLLIAAAGAVALYFLARRDNPPRTRAEIERRHPQLLVHIEPMASPPGKPVVTVDNFPALVKLAERYGQMILTWRRPDADDFVVRDEGITYRYRIPLDEPVLQNIEHLNRPLNTGTHRRKASSQVS